ncbi:WD40 repeat domain-containing protein [Neptunomonas phycophila]|uniref:WD40 repeat domain-containing protein n=1 Tax=Neptunomonas phycophila TaxID=1572645 RepID=UPI0009F83B57|nr:hypothetical protein [Neptunomonas phycophila]
MMPVITGKLLPLALICGLLSACDNTSSPSDSQRFTTLGAYSGAISQDGSLAVVGAQEEGGSLWNIQRKARLYDWNHASGERSLIAATSFSPDGLFAATATQQDLVLWHTDTGQAEWFWKAPGEILDMALGEQGQYALLGLSNQAAVYFDIINGGIKQTLPHQARVRTVDLSDDAELAITGADDYTTTVWNLATAEPLHTLTLDNVIDVAALSPDGRLAFSASTLDKAIIWDTASGKVLHTLSSSEGLIPKRVSYVAARFSSNGNQLLTGTSSGLIQLWNSQTGQLTKSWRAQKREAYGPNSTSIYDVAFGSNGTYYAMGSNGVLNTLR